MEKWIGGLTAVLIVTGMATLVSSSLQNPPYWEGSVMLVEDSQITVVAGDDFKSYTISGTSALAALDAAATAGGFDYTINDDWYDQYGALLVDSIANRAGDAFNGWQYWVNYPEEPLPWTSADKHELQNGDVIHWYYGGYGSTPDSSSMVILIHVSVSTHL